MYNFFSIICFSYTSHNKGFVKINTLILQNNMYKKIIVQILYRLSAQKDNNKGISRTTKNVVKSRYN